MPDSNTAGEVMPNFLDYHIYKHLESDKIGITDAKDKVKSCVGSVDPSKNHEMTVLDTTNYRYYAKQRIVDGILISSISTMQQHLYLDLIILSYLSLSVSVRCL